METAQVLLQRLDSSSIPCSHECFATSRHNSNLVECRFYKAPDIETNRSTALVNQQNRVDSSEQPSNARIVTLLR